MSQEFWNNRYKTEAYAYGKTPNVFFAEELQKHPLGSILLPLEGEGRNAIFAANLGWKVTAFDSSQEGQNKALKLAQDSGVEIDYTVADIQDIYYPKASFDALGFVFAHLPHPIRKPMYRKLASYVKPGGLLIIEGYSKAHHKYNSVDKKVGGPDNPELLYSRDMLLDDFKDFDILSLEEKDVTMSEGLFHNGKSAVIRLVGRKRLNSSH